MKLSLNRFLDACIIGGLTVLAMSVILIATGCGSSTIKQSDYEDAVEVPNNIKFYMTNVNAEVRTSDADIAYCDFTAYKKLYIDYDLLPKRTKELKSEIDKLSKMVDKIPQSEQEEFIRSIKGFESSLGNFFYYYCGDLEGMLEDDEHPLDYAKYFTKLDSSVYDDDIRAISRNIKSIYENRTEYEEYKDKIRNNDKSFAELSKEYDNDYLFASQVWNDIEYLAEHTKALGGAFRTEEEESDWKDWSVYIVKDLPGDITGHTDMENKTIYIKVGYAEECFLHEIGHVYLERHPLTEEQQAWLDNLYNGDAEKLIQACYGDELFTKYSMSNKTECFCTLYQILKTYREIDEKIGQNPLKIASGLENNWF